MTPAPTATDADVKLPGTEDVPVQVEPPADKPPATDKPKRQRNRSTAGTKPRGPGRPSNAAKLESQLTQLFSTIAVAGQLATMTNPVVSRDFVIVGHQAEPLAQALVKCAETNPAVRRVLESLVQTSAYGELITVVVGGILLPVLANHGVLPAFIAGTIDGVETMADAPPPPAA